MADAQQKSREELEAEWWAEWWKRDYSWEGLGALKDDGTPKHPWEGWIVLTDGTLAEDPEPQRYTGSTSNKGKLPPEARLATLQDYWRDQEKDLIADPTSPKNDAGKHTRHFTLFHLPLHWQDGTATGKADWKGTERGKLNQVIAEQISRSNEIPPRTSTASSLDGRVQFQGGVFLRFNVKDFHNSPAETEATPEPFQLKWRSEFAYFAGKTGFNSATFSGDALLNSVTFSGDARFNSATFSGYVRFDCATFYGKSEFNSATFSGYTWFNSAAFSGSALFIRATFSGSALFISTTFSGGALFKSATFSGESQFNSAIFSDDAWFPEATFSGKAGFNSATFSGLALFSRATFSGEAWFVCATFSGDAQFSNAAFSRDAWFDSATFSQGAFFNRVQIQASGSFSEAVFSGQADFGQAELNSGIVFDGMRLAGPHKIARRAFLITSGLVLGTVLICGLFTMPTGPLAPWLCGLLFIALFVVSGRVGLFAARNRDENLVSGQSSMRTLRKVAREALNHELEAIAHAAELKYSRLRWGKTWTQRLITKPAERVFSIAYEAFSDYGRSLIRPILWVIVLIPSMAGVYFLIDVPNRQSVCDGGAVVRVLASKPSGCVETDRDAMWQALDFSLANAFKPLSAISSASDQREQNPLAYRLLFDEDAISGVNAPLIIDGPGLGIRVIAILQSLLSLILAFLCALAVRRRFQIN